MGFMDICRMKQILLFGAGKSATVLIDYLLEHAPQENWQLIVADANLSLAESKIGTSANGKAISFDIAADEQRGNYIRGAAIVISMLPPHLHNLVAKDCVKFSRNLLTASYVDDDMRAMKQEIESKELLFLCEMGLDPGIDHMSAMRIIDQVHAQGGKITSFKSHCGGLVAPESDDNPWHYKVSWNPRNIILAGKSGAHYREKQQEVRLTHEQLFSGKHKVEVPGCGPLNWYPNRDSLSYAGLYQLEDTDTLIRTTLRHPDFLQGWSKIVQLRLTDETPAYLAEGRPLPDLLDEHLQKHGLVLSHFTDNDPLFLEQLDFLGFLDQGFIVNKGLCSAADLLQFAVEKKLSLQPKDRDMIVMLHEFEYQMGSTMKTISSSLVVKGDDSVRTAMAKTVGLPLAIATKLILQGKITVHGLRIPTVREIYEPVLEELEARGVRFEERTS